LAGKLPWKDLFEPAIKLCEEGFKIAKALAQGLSQKEDFIKTNSGLREVFINPMTNSVYKQNEVIKRLKYAQTLRNISLNGYELFYKGAMTKIIVDEINHNGSFIYYSFKI
jgi:gamma-glutamyltranspeptidase/glutathione hydrolase/leukotriene-C4 hydrolase